ncbi:MAG: hypothetical protein Q9M50_00110 [Methylococcales bacterium]|nr:hypothetical protein [Methylococcales bacterium]
MILKIYGLTKSKGTLEDGTKYDSAKVYSMARLKSADNHNGFAGIQLRGTPEIYEKWLDFPYTKEATNLRRDKIKN